MGRPLRIQFPGAIYHVTARGNNKQEIFIDKDDAIRLLEFVEQAVVRYGIIVHAYCLMNNHYHFLIETPDGNLSEAMQFINLIYTKWFNKRYWRVGHVFQGRFKSKLIETDEHMLEVCRYIVNNPKRARYVRDVGDYTWSSYRQTIGNITPKDWLTVSWTLSQFAESYDDAVRRYAAFVNDCL